MKDSKKTNIDRGEKSPSSVNVRQTILKDTKNLPHVLITLTIVVILYKISDIPLWQIVLLVIIQTLNVIIYMKRKP